MSEISNWILPLTFIPGVALLINTTNQTFLTLKGEIQRLLREQPEGFRQQIPQQVRRLNMVAYTLVSFYISTSLFAICSFIGGLLDASVAHQEQIITLTLCLGVIFLVVGALLLVVESALAIKIVKRQCYFIEE